jgi:CRP/FNR family cyclic AMP-dependent transcriptional regulator
MKKVTFSSGQTIFKAGDAADGLYIVGSGRIGVFFPSNSTHNEPDIILEKTQILGEMGVIDTASRMATARAIEDCTLVFVSRSEFDKKLEDTDPVVRGVLAILSSRLRDVQRRR